jgi:cytochrome c biogenesis protein
LRLKTPLRRNAAWTLSGKDSSGELIVSAGGRRIVLKPGQSAHLAHGSLRFDELRTWMGYKIFYDPTLPWLFGMAVIGVGGLAWHFWRGLAASRWREASVPAVEPAPAARHGAAQV